MKTKKIDLGYYNKTAHESLLASINRNATRLNKALEIWNRLETGPLEMKDLPFLIRNDSDFFAKLHENRVWLMIDALALPTVTKQTLFHSSISPFFPEFKALLDNWQNSFSHLGSLMISISGGMRNFQILPEYYEFVEGKIFPAKDVEERTRGFFQVIADTEDKLEALNLFHELADKMTLFSTLLDRTGFFPATEPLFEKSMLFGITDGKYEARIEALL